MCGEGRTQHQVAKPRVHPCFTPQVMPAPKAGTPEEVPLYKGLPSMPWSCPQPTDSSPPTVPQHCLGQDLRFDVNWKGKESGEELGKKGGRGSPLTSEISGSTPAPTHSMVSHDTPSHLPPLPDLLPSRLPPCPSCSKKFFFQIPSNTDLLVMSKACQTLTYQLPRVHPFMRAPLLAGRLPLLPPHNRTPEQKSRPAFKPQWKSPQPPTLSGRL